MDSSNSVVCFAVVARWLRSQWPVLRHDPTVIWDESGKMDPRGYQRRG